MDQNNNEKPWIMPDEATDSSVGSSVNVSSADSVSKENSGLVGSDPVHSAAPVVSVPDSVHAEPEFQSSNQPKSASDSIPATSVTLSVGTNNPDHSPAPVSVPTPPSPQPPVSTSVTHSQPKISEHRHKSRLSLLWWLLAVLVLVVLGIIGAVYADDNGQWDNGLSAKLGFLPVSSWWNGLSAVPSAASGQVLAAITQQPGLEYTGTMTVSQATGESTGSAVAQSNVFFNLLAVPSTNFDFTYVRNNYSAKFSFSDTGVITAGEYRVVGGQAYFSGNFGSTNGSTSTSWLKLGNAPSFSIGSIFNILADDIKQASFVGNEKINNTDVYHFNTTISGNLIPIFAQSNPNGLLGSWAKGHGPLDIWVSRITHLPYEFKLSLNNPSTGQILVVSAVLSPQMASRSITAPSGSNVISATVTPDQQRKNDLKTIASALQKYYASNGVFPKSLSTDKLNNPDSILVQALVPNYLTTMPSDPNSKYYYAYTSNGSTYSLSAVLDNANDPDGVKSGSLTLYILNGN